MPPKHHDATSAEKMLGLYTLLLLSTHPWSLTQLAEHFKCSKPTILRLLQKIERYAGVTLQSESRSEGYAPQKWYWLERDLKDAERHGMALQQDEMRLLHFCRDLATPFLPPPLCAVLDDSLRRASVLLPTRPRSKQAKTPVLHPALLGSIDYGPFQTILQQLLTAIETRHVCEIRYASDKNPERTHEMAVTGMVSGRQALYVRGWCVFPKGKVTARHPLFLAVHRIREVIPTRRIHVLSSPSEDVGFGIMEGEAFAVRVQFTADAALYVRERVFSPDQRIEDVGTEGSIILSFTARSEPEVLSWVMSFGSKAQALAPAWLVQEIYAEAKELARLHIAEKI